VDNYFIFVYFFMNLRAYYDTILSWSKIFVQYFWGEKKERKKTLLKNIMLLKELVCL